jgi:hypothetical protein
MDDEAPIARYDPTPGSLQLRLTGGEEIMIVGLGPDLPLWRGQGDAAALPLWLTMSQADVLGKMIEYILQRVKISPESRAVLEDLAPQVGQLLDELVAAAASADGGFLADETDGGE